MAQNHPLPKGFEGAPDKQLPLFKAASATESSQPMVNFHGRPGGPGRDMGKTIEHAENVRGTLARLMTYFAKSRRLLVMLLISVACVTVAGLLAPALQGSAIDNIADSAWAALRKGVIVLLIVYAVNVLFTLAQSLLAARLSQSITRQMRHDLFRKMDHLSIRYLDSHSNGDVMSRMTHRCGECVLHHLTESWLAGIRPAHGDRHGGDYVRLLLAADADHHGDGDPHGDRHEKDVPGDAQGLP